jgi:hypothetical protein
VPKVQAGLGQVARDRRQRRDADTVGNMYARGHAAPRADIGIVANPDFSIEPVPVDALQVVDVAVGPELASFAGKRRKVPTITLSVQSMLWR